MDLSLVQWVSEEMFPLYRFTIVPDCSWASLPQSLFNMSQYHSNVWCSHCREHQVLSRGWRPRCPLCYSHCLIICVRQLKLKWPSSVSFWWLHHERCSIKQHQEKRQINYIQLENKSKSCSLSQPKQPVLPALIFFFFFLWGGGLVKVWRSIKKR